MRGEGGVAGEGRVVGLPRFPSWDKCTMLLTLELRMLYVCDACGHPLSAAVTIL